MLNSNNTLILYMTDHEENQMPKKRRIVFIAWHQEGPSISKR